MAVRKQIHLLLILFFFTKTACGSSTDSKPREEVEEVLVQSESKDGKLEIIKRIKKINEDGSYTIGYEADDGSFKIESRDVLGHIKGTYGFVDDQGQIKRVSYSTSNSSEVIAKPYIPIESVVQRIPSKNKTTTSTPKHPTYIFSSTVTTPITTANSVVQSIAKRRTSSTTSATTPKPNYKDVVNVNKATTRPNYVTYSSAAPRVLVQGRSSPEPTESSHISSLRNEGQLGKPEVVTVKPSELPSFRQLALKHLEDEKPVNEDPEPELASNILRRQLPQRNNNDYNIREHVYRLQQSIGHDATDVYSSSMTTGTPRPLFTTTNKPFVYPSTTAPTAAPEPDPSYISNYQRNNLQEVEQRTQEYIHETTTAEPIRHTPTPIPVAQIPANRAEHQEPLVAIRHPNQRHTILVPLSQIRGRLVPVRDFSDNYQRQYSYPQEQYLKETTPRPAIEVEQQQAVVRRLPPPSLRPIPVQVDQDGFIREMPRQSPGPYPIPIPVTNVAEKYVDDIDNDITNIQPPVSTRDLQKLLQQLIVRQSRLERISALTRNRENYQQQPQQQARALYSNPAPYFIERVPASTSDQHHTEPVQYIRQHTSDTRQKYVEVRRPDSIYEDQYDQQSYRPNRRFARLLSPQTKEDEELDHYLPSDVREMLLLRMLQLAINPTMPIKDEDFNFESKAQTVKRMPVRNVEILGEEESAEAQRMYASRTKRHKAIRGGY